MEKVLEGFLQRNLPGFADRFEFEITGGGAQGYSVCRKGQMLHVKANSAVNAAAAVYSYLKTYCNVQLSWCGNREIKLASLPLMPENETICEEYPQKYRVYMNYCTLGYSMCWWDFERWEKEIDFMAMNGVNMPLSVVGSEAVWYETLLEFGFTKKEALSTISGPAFWPWQMMTNIEGYMPPEDEKYVYERLELGRKILARYVEYGMIPIQQGFSGHVPVLLADKFPQANILKKSSWCGFQQTAQLDPLDPLFKKMGTVYLNKLKELMGFHHYVACDPFHEGAPPKPWKRYLKSVGKAIDSLYKDFDSDSVWVMQAWSLRKHIATAVPKNRLIILDINSRRTAAKASKNMWGYPVIAGMLHNFGGKNAMQGKLKEHCKNPYYQLKKAGANVVGSGLFMEGIDQNPAVYELQFSLLTKARPVDFDSWLNDYIKRRYGGFSPVLKEAWLLLCETCYSSFGYEENAVGSSVASRPCLLPATTGPCCFARLYYDVKKLEKAARIFLSAAEEYAGSDGYQYDLCDIFRQVLSNRFHSGQIEYNQAFKKKNPEKTAAIAASQLMILKDMDDLLAHRSEFCLSKWLESAHRLASDDDEKKYFDYNARTLITLWGDVNAKVPYLYDYSWREWSGMVGDYYYTRWKMFYEECERCLKQGVKLETVNGTSDKNRMKARDCEFGERLYSFESEWAKQYCEYEYPQDSNVIPLANKLAEKYSIGKI